MPRELARFKVFSVLCLFVWPIQVSAAKPVVGLSWSCEAEFDEWKMQKAGTEMLQIKGQELQACSSVH